MFEKTIQLIPITYEIIIDKSIRDVPDPAWPDIRPFLISGIQPDIKFDIRRPDFSCRIPDILSQNVRNWKKIGRIVDVFKSEG